MSTRPPLTTMTRMAAAAAALMAREGVPNRACSDGQAVGQRALGRQPLKQEPGVIQRGSRRGDEQQARPRR